MDELWVADTSSIVEVRRIVRRQDQDGVFRALSQLVNDDVLIYPVQVVKELERYKGGGSGQDRPYEWVKENQEHATRHGTDFESLKAILEHPQVRQIVDPDKIGVEEADPYVLELAARFRETYAVTVLTEEIRDKPAKLSMNTACGLLRLVPLRMGAFLVQQGIWQGSE